MGCPNKNLVVTWVCPHRDLSQGDGQTHAPVDEASQWCDCLKDQNLKILKYLKKIGNSGLCQIMICLDLFHQVEE